MTVSNQRYEFPITRIRDSENAARAIVFALMFGTVLYISSYYSDNLTGKVMWFVYGSVLTVPSVTLAINRNRGVLIDPNRDLLEYYGGGIPADSVFDYVNPIFWMQPLRWNGNSRQLFGRV